MRYTLEDLLEIYANINEVALEEVKKLYKKGDISKICLLEAYLEEEGIFGYTTALWHIFESLFFE